MDANFWVLIAAAASSFLPGSLCNFPALSV
jgi:hypothetical protein